MASILITGGTGYLGSHLVKDCIAGGHRVAILKRRASPLVRLHGYESRISMFDLDQGGLGDALRADGGVDAIIHTATAYGRRGENWREVFATNTDLPLRVLSAAIDQGVKLFINTDTVLDPFVNPYALSKTQFREWGQLLARDGATCFVNLRLEHFFGPKDDPTKFTTHVIRSCIENRPRLELTVGEQIRDFIYIDDVVSAYRAVLDKHLFACSGYLHYDVGSGVAVSIRSFVETIHRLSTSTTILDFGAVPYRENEAMYSQADTAALRSLGWMCVTMLDDGIRKTIEGESVS